MKNKKKKSRQTIQSRGIKIKKVAKKVEKMRE